MVIIESYAYDLPGQSGFVAREATGNPVAASRSFRTLIDKVQAMGHGSYRLKHAGVKQGKRIAPVAIHEHPG